MQINLKNYEILSHVNNALIDLINKINRKKITENKHPDKVNNIAEEVQAGNTSEKLLINHIFFVSSKRIY